MSFDGRDGLRVLVPLSVRETAGGVSATATASQCVVTLKGVGLVLRGRMTRHCGESNVPS